MPVYCTCSLRPVIACITFFLLKMRTIEDKKCFALPVNLILVRIVTLLMLRRAQRRKAFLFPSVDVPVGRRSSSCRQHECGRGKKTSQGVTDSEREIERIEGFVTKTVCKCKLNLCSNHCCSFPTLKYNTAQMLSRFQVPFPNLSTSPLAE